MCMHCVHIIICMLPHPPPPKIIIIIIIIIIVSYTNWGAHCSWMQGMKRVDMYSAVPRFLQLQSTCTVLCIVPFKGVFVHSFNSLHTTSATYNCNMLPSWCKRMKFFFFFFFLKDCLPYMGIANLSVMIAVGQNPCMVVYTNFTVPLSEKRKKKPTCQPRWCPYDLSQILFIFLRVDKHHFMCQEQGRGS